MRRIFTENFSFSEDLFILKDVKKIHHLKDVLRIAVGERIVCCDNQGRQLLVIIQKITPAEITLKKEKDISGDKNDAVSITVACALPKRTRMEDIVDKLTQLGVAKIIPLLTERVVVRLNQEKEAHRINRWRKIAQGASEQSQRGLAPAIETITTLREMITSLKEYDLKLIPTLAGEKKPINKVLSKLQPQQKPLRVLVLIGPEGDFTEEEVNLAIKAGCIPVSLGDLVLRVDTAAIAVVSYLRFLLL